MWLFAFWRPPFALRSCIFNLKDGTVIQGVLFSTRGPWFTLKNALLLTAGQPATPIDGEAVIERSHISFTQVLP